MRFFQLLTAFAMMAPFCLICLRSANGNWQDAGNDDTYEGLKFYELTLECNDALLECEKRFSGHFAVKGLPFIAIDHVLKYTKDPYQINFDSTVATAEINVSFNQDDPSEIFKVCSEMTEDKIVPVIGLYQGKWNLCLENDFSGITVPAECAVPVAVSKVVSSLNDEKIIGQQVLYCMPS